MKRDGLKRKANLGEEIGEKVCDVIAEWGNKNVEAGGWGRKEKGRRTFRIRKKGKEQGR